SIPLPPLRERPEDIEPLALHFLRRFATRMAKEIYSISPEALVALQSYGWPGNVRELENVMERAVILTGGSSVQADVIPLRGSARTVRATDSASAVSPHTPRAVMLPLEEIERQHIEMVLKGTGYHKSRTAEILGISRRTLDRRIEDFGLMDGQGAGNADV
ncbi:MAG: sigma-54-dependent Fis family transcriptional regulator, partial [Steroidobacteraceae bacterium]|nr:sigma-54-dependent Fis family transcriptional regulator [Deltaproteobacteria bacterium]